MRDDREHLTDILEAIDRAQRYAVRGRAAFEGDELIQAWMVRQLRRTWPLSGWWSSATSQACGRLLRIYSMRAPEARRTDAYRS